MPITARSLERPYKIDGDLFNRQYKEHLSNYREWEHLDHAEDYLVYAKNIGTHLSIDETALTSDELYTIVENKDAHGKSGTIVAIVKGTKSEDLIKVLNKIPQKERNNVQEVTMDLAENMKRAVKSCFHNARITIDRFHVQKLAQEAVSSVRVKYRWLALDNDNKLRKEAQKRGERYEPATYENGDTEKELLARCRYALFKYPDKWTDSQRERAEIVFDRYPEIKKAYDLAQRLRSIFNKRSNKDAARTNLARWYNDIEEANMEQFRTLAHTIQERYDEVLNYFVEFSTNANAESFNAKVKQFRGALRGVSDVKYFLFRLTNI